MRILTRYLIREYVNTLLLLQAVFVLIYLVVDLNRIYWFLEYNASGWNILEYYLYKIPLIIFQTVPVAVLIGALVLVGGMAKNNEITILRAGGINLLRVVFPLLAISALISVSIFLFNEFLVSYTNKKVEYVERIKIKKKPPRSLFSGNWIWFRSKDGLFYNIKEISSGTDIFGKEKSLNITLSGVSIFSFDENFKVKHRIDAQHMWWDGKNWRLKQVQEREFSDKIKYKESQELVYDKITDKPKDFDQVTVKPKNMSLRELRAYVKSLKTKGFKTAKYEVEIQARLAHPLISLVMVLLAVPFTLTARRSGGQTLGFTLGIVIGFWYWVVLSAGYALGRGGAISPVIAIWMANLLFSVFGIYRLFKIDS